ncbi:MAG: formylglycine-generating enzyme family protein [Gammaproteobacteria bacterium]|nr:formylglycine-generating enzyme family protein [Gammaproteobacteria bacterium]
MLRADAGVLHVASLTKPAWAKEIGRDRYGLWAEFKLENVSQRLRWIPPGRFLMGSPKSEPERSYWEGPRHEVTLTEGFWLFDTTVTQALWKAVTGKNPSRFKGPDRPVENVSWNDAQEFIATVNGILPGSKFRLPTEAQWEYACRAGTQTPFYFGDNIMPEQVNYNGYFSYAGGAKGVRRGETVAVKSLPPNAWGLYEMHGNVWEWCEDYWSDNYPAEAQTDSAGPTVDGSRVFRGGSWDNYARDVRSAYRDRLGPDSRFGYRGFRCARVQA